MIPPLQVIHQVQEGQAPANWCVLHPVRFFGPIASFILEICAGMLFMLYGTLFMTGATQPARLHQGGAGPFGHRNGSSETCRVSNTYRSPEWIARHIIGAHLRFKESSPLSSP
jgi:hypothetical protein